MAKNININASISNESAKERRLFDAKKQQFETEAKGEWLKSSEWLSFKNTIKWTLLIAFPVSFIITYIIGVENHYEETFLFAFYYMWYCYILVCIVLFILYLTKRHNFIKTYISEQIAKYYEE